MRKSVRHPGQLFLMLRMAWWVGVVSLMARSWSLPRALKVVSGGSYGRSGQGNTTPDHLAHTIDQLLSADVLWFRPKCWKRAAVLRRYLLQNGIFTTVVFGVRRDQEGKLDGHAWLESNGQPILESSALDYVVTFRFPSSEADTSDFNRVESQLLR
jgi:hypothetical protein